MCFIRQFRRTEVTQRSGISVISVYHTCRHINRMNTHFGIQDFILKLHHVYIYIYRSTETLDGGREECFMRYIVRSEPVSLLSVVPDHLRSVTVRWLSIF